MAKNSFDEAELYLLENWTDARLFERSMGRLRESYRLVLDRALDDVERKHPELDRRGVYLNIDEDNENDTDTANIGRGRSAWPSMEARKYPTGLWLCGISLGELAKHEDHALGCVWIRPPEDSRLAFSDVADQLKESSKRILRGVEVQENSTKTEASIEYSLPESRKKLLELLVKGESQAFISCLSGHFDTLAKFIPTVDKICKQIKQKR